MRIKPIIFGLAILPALALAQQRPVIADTDQDQVQAATANAAGNLRDQILRTHLTRDLRVGDYLDQTNRQAELTRILNGAEPVGGPRWVDDRTCQVRLELPASQVAAMLMGIAHEPGEHSPITPETLKSKFSDWNRLKFTVVGSSAGGDAIESAKPAKAAGIWTEISEYSRKSAIDQARADATKQMVGAIGPLSLNETAHASDALAHPAIADPLNSWLTHRPVTRIEFLDDLKVSVTISIAPKSLAGAFRSAVQCDPTFAHSIAIDWDHVNQQIEELPGSMVGSATVAAPATSLPSVVLPLTPPDWVDEQLQAEATASGGGSRLKIGRSAEADAVGKLRDQFLMLHIDPSTTLGDAAGADPQLNQAVDRAMLHAHTYRVDYNANGSVRVKVDLDLRDAWDALRANP